MYNRPSQSVLFCRIHAPAFSDQPFVFSFVCMCHEQLKRRSGDAYLNTCTIHRAQSQFFCRIHTPAFSDRLFYFFRVYMSRAVEESFRRCLFEYMYNSPRTNHFLATYTPLPFLTAHSFFCACICHKQLKRRSGNAHLKTCIIRRAQPIYLARTHSCLF